MPVALSTTLLASLDLLGLMMAGGALSTLIWLIPQDLSADWQQALRSQLWRLLGMAWLELSLISPLLLLDRTINLSHQVWPTVNLLLSVISQTHYGHIWLQRITALILGWLILAIRGRLGSLADKIMPLALLLLIAYRSASGHAADMGDWSLLQFADGFHQACAMIWGGCLLAIMPALWLVRRKKITAPADLYVDFALRLSRLAAIGLTGVLVTGFYMAWHQLGQLSLLLTTRYGQILSFKLSLVALMALLGASNRFWHIPRLVLSRGLTQAGLIWHMLPPNWRQALQRSMYTTPERAWRGLLKTASWEAALMVAILIIVSLLINTMPHMHMAM